MKLIHRALSGLGLTVVLLSQVSRAKLAAAPTSQFNSFTDWCLNREKISLPAKYTVEVLLQRIGTTECRQANQRLSHLNELKIVLSQISDLNPIASLTNLKALTLGGNRISDISPLKSLTNLTELNLPGNRINDVNPLKSLVNLTSLNLARNLVSDINPLKSLINLTSLNLARNLVSDINPLKSLTNLTELDIQDNPVSSGACREIVRPGYAAYASGRIDCRL